MNETTKAALIEQFNQLHKCYDAITLLTDKENLIKGNDKLSNAIAAIYCAYEDYGFALERMGLKLEW